MNNFLSIVWYKVLPPVFGGQKGIALFNEYLGKQVPLTCLCSADNVSPGNLSYQILNDLPVSKAQFWNPFVRKKILDRIKTDRSTHIIIEHPYHGWLGRHKQRLGFTFIVHAHNIEHLRMKARGKRWWRQIRAIEEEAFGYADLILFKTGDDRDLAMSLFDVDPGRSLVLPYGITRTGPPHASEEGRRAFRMRHGIAQEEKILLFAGSLAYEPNRQALHNLAVHIIPALRRKNFPFRVILCGGNSPHIANLPEYPEIIPAGEVEDIDPYFLFADLFINPVTSGSGIQTKNIDALASGLSIACTEFAAKGLPPYLHRQQLFISPNTDWEQFAENIIAAVSPGKDVPQRFYEEYHWENIIGAFLRRLPVKG